MSNNLSIHDDPCLFELLYWDWTLVIVLNCIIYSILAGILLKEKQASSLSPPFLSVSLPPHPPSFLYKYKFMIFTILMC